MTDKKVKEMSIESIKKELIDELVNNLDILNYLEIYKDEYIRLSKIHNSYIYDYDNPNVTDNYITVDVAEYESTNTAIRDTKKYIVSIKMGLVHDYNLDKLSAIVKRIVLKLYPYIRTYKNVPIYVKKEIRGYNAPNGYYEANALNRMIKFEIAEQSK